MKITDIFIKRPILSICVNLLIIVGGYQAFQSLNIRQYPRIDSSAAIIRTAYVGASPDLVRGFVTTPLERVLASIEGIDYLESESKLGLSTITVRLKLNYDTNAALSQIQSKISQVRNDLPPEAEVPTVTIENTDNRFAAMYISFYSEQLEANQITDFLLRVVQPKLSSINGVQKAEILGARQFAVRIWLDSNKMAGHGLTAAAVRQALVSNNYLSAIGTSKGELIQINLRANTDLTNIEEFRNIPVKQGENGIVRLADIADVQMGAENYNEDVRFSGEQATFMGIWVLPTSNSLDVISEVRKVLPELERNLPGDLKIAIPYDTTSYIRDALNEVFKTLSETIVIVIIVIFIFIGSLRAVIIPIVAIPLSLIGALMLMYVAGFSINLLTLLGIVLAVGLVVDDAIVMLENIERNMRQGLKPVEAALQGARELVTPVISMTITLAAVYLPIALQAGLTGALFREFALSLAGAVVISGFVALTLSPMMCAKILKEKESSRFKLRMDAFFERLDQRYEKFLHIILSARTAVVIAAIFFILFIPYFYMFSAKELAPREDQGIVFGVVQTPPDSTLEQTTQYTRDVFKMYKTVPEFDASFQLTGANFGFSGIRLKPWSERSRTAEEIQFSLREPAAKISGIQLLLVTPAALPGGSNFPVEMVINTTAQPLEVWEFSNQLVGKAMQSGLFNFALTDLKFDQPEVEVVLDRNKIASLGLNLQQVGADLTTQLGGNYVNRFSISGQSYKVIPQIERSSRLNPEQLLNLNIPGPNGGLIPLSSVATLKTTTQPRQLNKFQQLNSAKIQGMPRFGVSIDKALNFLETEAANLLPKGYSVDYAGEARQLRQEGNSLVKIFAISMIVIFLVLAAQFESFRDPLIIIIGSVPLALATALFFTFLNFTSINVYSQVGLITLIGLVSKNGILIVEFANALQEKGLSKFEAIVQGSGQRLRPILMTSIATVFGHLPLIFASGAGSGARNSIGYVLVTGMAFGTVLTLFVVPALYMLIAKDRSAHE